MMKKQLAAIGFALAMAVSAISGVEVAQADVDIITKPAVTVETPKTPVIKTVKCTKAGTVKITLAKNASGASGYQVKYALNSKFTGAKTKKFTGNTVTLTDLSKKSYYFKVRAYKKSGTETAYSKWSAVKKKTVKGASSFTYKTSDFSLQLPSNWKGNYVADESNFEGLNRVAFFEKKCYQETNQQCGWLFSIGVYKDDSYKEMPSYEVIKKGKTYTYVATFPTDVQFWGTSKKAQANYGKMTSQIEKILDSFKEL